MTLRSLTHHLSLCDSSDVVPFWQTHPAFVTSPCLNLLVLPWPKRISPIQFERAEGSLDNLDRERFGFFDYKVAPDDTLVDHVLRCLDQAKALVGNVDGIVLPELSITPLQHETLKKRLVDSNVFLIAGVGETRPSAPGRNYAALDIPIKGGKPAPYSSIKQAKHHRWKVDRKQVVQYGLGSRLDPSKSWWEHIEIEPRRLTFVALQDWLAMCVLICEDLARQDPISEIVRSIGPNLVVALLLDGPQLPARWPGRYATVLADDPGSSVLTVTSSGMMELSRPAPGETRSRTIALWKDATSPQAIPIELPSNSSGVVLSLSREWYVEFTADGRSDRGVTGNIIPSGIHTLDVQH